jgi:hypothetical protein
MHLKITKAAAAWLCLLFALCSFAPGSSARAQAPSTGFKEIEPNVHAPQFYSDHLNLKMTLVNLPGAGEPGSSWEASYQIFFIAEADFKRAIAGRPPGGWNPTPADFPTRLMLGQGTFKRASLQTLPDRSYLSSNIPLKMKVADRDRTKYAVIMTSYSVKIFDARLKTSVYRSGVFIARPFVEEAGGGESARRLLHANFFVNPEGRLFYSQRPRNSEATTWP